MKTYKIVAEDGNTYTVQALDKTEAQARFAVTWPSAGVVRKIWEYI